MCKKKIINLLFQLPLILMLLFLCILPVSATSVEFDYDFQKDVDSLNTLIKQCNVDTCRFNILQQYYWQYADLDFNRAKPVGEWAYNEIKNSKNSKALSDGLDIKGCILENEEKIDSAGIVFRKALKLAQTIDYKTRIGWSLYHLALINRKLGYNDSSIYYYKTNIGFNKSAGFTYGAWDVTLELAWFFNELNQPDSAIFYFNKSLEYSRQLADIEKEFLSTVKIASFYNLRNDIKNEVKYLNEALILAPESKNPKALINIYNSIGNLFYEQKRNFPMALEYYNKVLELCTNNTEDFKAVVLLDIANLYYQMGNDSLALNYTKQSLEISRRINIKHQISEGHKNLGLIYMRQGKLNDAIENLNFCFNLGCDKCPKITFHSSLIQIAHAYRLQRNPSKELEYLKKSLQLAIDFNANTEMSISYLELGNYYRGLTPSLTRKYYLSAIDKAQNSNNIKVIKTVADTLSSFFRQEGNYKLAYNFNVLAREMADSIIHIEQQESMAEWELKSEFEKIQQEAKVQQATANREKAYRNSLLLISGILIIFGFWIYRSYHRKKSDNKILEGKNLEIEQKNKEILDQVEEISAQKDEIERISRELHQSDELKLRFFANISHEFRTPLTLILNPAKKLLETLTLDSEHKKQLQHIYSNAQKLHDLTNQIMDLQKLDAGKLQLNLEKADIVGYCLGIASSFESLCDKKTNTLKFIASQRAVMAAFDKDKIGKIVINLLSNALKFCNEGTIVDIQIGFINNNFTLSVSDKGIGIPENQVELVFKRYYQVSPEKQAEGTGIGLAYIKELVAFMNGSVNIKSKVNEGTIVEVSLPVGELEIIDNTPFNINIPESGEKKPLKEFDLAEYNNENEKSILIVEDNDELRGFIADIFKADFNIHLAKDGDEGLKAAARFIPDIIISDVMMPNMNGFDLCTAIKNDEHTSHIPVLLLTAKDTAQSSMDGYNSGADDYILKPFDNEILKLKVRNILKTKQALSRQYNSELNILPNAGSYSDVDKNFMKKCILTIESNMANSGFSVEILATELGFSRSNLYRKIISLTNLNPAELIRNIRMQYAAKLFKTSDLRVNEVAFEVGYDNTAKFSQAFKKHHGVLPSKISTE